MAKKGLASLIVFGPKESMSVRFRIDYRRLSFLTLRDSYLIPKMKERISLFCDALKFSTRNADFWYWQVGIGDADHPKPALTFHFGLHSVPRMPFGLHNAHVVTCALCSFNEKIGVLMSLRGQEIDIGARPYFHTFLGWGRTYKACSHCSVALIRSLRHFENWKVYVHLCKYWLFWVCI